MSYLEAHMIEPIRRLMLRRMGVDVTVQEFSAGYGVADLVGAKLCVRSCRTRERIGIAQPLSHYHLISVLLLLKRQQRTSIEYILERITISERTLRSNVIPKMKKLGLIVSEGNGYVRLQIMPPNPARNLVAVEAKQSKWREAILQARRYSFFADQTYIAVWEKTVPSVDLTFLRKHRLGLLSVTPEAAKIVIPAPSRLPRVPSMSRFCAEFLYDRAINCAAQGNLS